MATFVAGKKNPAQDEKFFTTLAEEI